jgi:DNA-binding XRE family transcriptional regulator
VARPWLIRPAASDCTTPRKSGNAIEAGSMTPSIGLALKLEHALEVPAEELFSLASGII